MNTTNGLSKKGVFGKKDIYYKVLSSAKETNDFFILFHGSFSSSYNSNKDSIIAQNLVDKTNGKVFLYETSRELYTFQSTLPFQEYKRVFGNKTFAEELEDTKTIVGYFIETVKKEMRNPRFHFVGFSLGGTLSSYLLPQYGACVENVFLFNSGVTTKGNGSTYPGYPHKEEILKNFSDYKGNIFLVQGKDDSVVPQQDAASILHAAPLSKSTNLIRINGIDHSFRKMNGEEKIPEIAKLISQIIIGNYCRAI